MTFSKAKLIPYAIAVGAIGLVGFLQSLRHWSQHGQMIERVEAMTYDWRQKAALNHNPPCATNLGFINIGDEDIRRVEDGMNGSLDYQFGLYWPRQVYARMVREIAAEGARLVAFDVLFAGLRPDHPPVMVGTNLVSSDEFLADEMRAANCVAIAMGKELLPHRSFRDAAMRVGDISTDKDSDGVLRRAHAFRKFPILHSKIEQFALKNDFDLSKTVIKSHESITLWDERRTTNIVVQLQSDNRFDIGRFQAQLGLPGPPEGVMHGVGYRELTEWHMGIVMAAAHLGLDLDKAEVDERRHEIKLPGTNGVSRVLPTDREFFFYVDWSIKSNDPRLTQENFTGLLAKEKLRRLGKPKDDNSLWKNKVIIVGSTATGNDLTDLGATPIEQVNPVA